MKSSGVPVGPATKVGVGAAAAAALAALVAIILGDRSQESIAALSSAVVVLVTVLVGRYAQSVAALFQKKPAAPAVYAGGGNIASTALKFAATKESPGIAGQDEDRQGELEPTDGGEFPDERDADVEAL